MNPAKPIFAFLVISIPLFIILFEILSFATFRSGLVEDGVFRGVKALSRGEFDSYLKERDDDLGWPTKTVLAQRYTGNGFRKSPAHNFINDGKLPCLAVYGDSFAFGDEVADTEAWANQLTQVLGCKVLNYGVSAYGTDQALMRFEKLHPKGIPAIMTFIDGDLGRNNNQVRGIWAGQIDVIRSKPRFLARDNAISTLSERKTLEKVGLPINRYEQLATLMSGENISSTFQHEYFLPDSSFESSITPSFPYSLSLVRLVWNKLISKISGYRNLSGKTDIVARFRLALKEFVPQQISRSDASIKLQKLILERFLQDCDDKDIQCGILRLPNRYELQYGFENSHVLNELTTSRLIRDHIVELNKDCLNKEFSIRGVSNNDIAKQKMPGGHYNALANQVMAVCLFKALGILRV